MTPRLTIGMATFDDAFRAEFTIQHIRLCESPETLAQVELLVVDNAPHTAGGQRLSQRLQNFRKGTAGCRYVAMPSPVGTTQPRNRVFEEARGEAVLCLDSHVLLAPGSIERLIRWYAEHPECLDLLSGPLLYDPLDAGPTHFDDVWRGQMWGTWGTAWQCGCGAGGLRFVPSPTITGRCEFFSLSMGRVPVTLCGACGRELPADMPFPQHEGPLAAAGYRPVGSDPDGEAFEIPGQGLGLFTCRRDAWLGFNPHFRAFGGEEMYVHEKYRQAGRKCLVLPFLRWWHQFGRVPGQLQYPLSKYGKVRNYVLGHQELGLPLDRVYDHFVSLDTSEPLPIHLVREHGVDPQAVNGKPPEQLAALHAAQKLPPDQWEYLLADPIHHELPPAASQPQAAPLPAATIDEVYAELVKKPRDLDKHMPTLKALAEQCEHVTEFSKRRESTVALLAGQPAALVSHNVERDPLLAALRTMAGRTELSQTDLQSPAVSEADFGETDLLFLDSQHTKARLLDELTRFAPRVRRWIVLHDTALYHERGEDGGEGLVAAIKAYLAEHGEWFVASHTREQYGLTVLSRNELDRPAQKVWLWPPEFGPGTEFKTIVEELGVTMPKSCTCRGMMVQMDMLGVAGCRQRKDELVKAIRQNQDGWGWSERWRNFAKAGTSALLSGLAFRISWTDPIPSLFDEAVERAAAKEPQESAA